MLNSISPTACLDQVWPKIKGYFVPHPVGRPRIHHPKRILEAIFWLAKAGCQWNMLPDSFPPYKTVYDYFRKWTNSSIWLLICKKTREALRISEGKNRYSRCIAIDSQSVRTFFGTGAVGFDGNKKIKGRKRHIVVDSDGLLIDLVATRANIHDVRGGRMLVARLESQADANHVKWVLADKAYESRHSQCFF